MGSDSFVHGAVYETKTVANEYPSELETTRKLFGVSLASTPGNSKNFQEKVESGPIRMHNLSHDEFLVSHCPPATSTP